MATSKSLQGVLLYDADSRPLVFKQGDFLTADDKGLIIGGKDDTSQYRMIRLDRYGNVPTIPSETTQSAFGETRTAETFQLAEYLHRYRFDEGVYGYQAVGGGAIAHIDNTSAISLSVTGADADSITVRTHTYHPHQAGRGMLIRQFIYMPDEGQTNQVRQWGYKDGTDGIFWRLSGTSLYIVRSTSISGSTVETTYSRDASEWSLDNMDGSGPSGEDLDVSKCNNYEVQVQWPTGTINFYINGILVHKVNTSNSISGPAYKVPNLPLSYSITNNGASTAGALNVISACVTIEGGENPLIHPFGISTPTSKEIGTTEVPILSIRPSLLFNTLENRILIKPIYGVISTETKSISFRLVLNGTLTAPSWSSVSSNDSGVEYDVAASAISGGKSLINDIVPLAPDYRVLELDKMFNYSSNALRRYAFGTDVNVLTLTAKNRASASTTLVNSTFNWHEVH